MSNGAHKPVKGGIGQGGKASYSNAPTIKFEQGDRVFDVHVITKKGRLLCPIGGCSKRYLNERSLTQHLSKKHDMNIRKTKHCPVCDDEFVTTERSGNTTHCSQSCASTTRVTNRQRCERCQNFLGTEETSPCQRCRTNGANQ